MSMSVGPAEGEGGAMSEINTTPLVDVMLVLLIIFLITIPVATKEVKIVLPEINNEAQQTTPETITITVDAKGASYWNGFAIRDEDLMQRMIDAAQKVPQPEVHIKGDKEARFEFIGRVVATAGRAGIVKVGFVTDPEPRDIPAGFF